MPVQAQVRDALLAQVLGEQIHQLDHLREDEHAVA